MGTIATFALAAKGMPSGDSFWVPSRPISVQIIDRYGQDLLVRGATEARDVSIAKLSPHMIDAVLSIEDRRFYSHVGVDPIGLARATRENFNAGRVVQGGSTLTQQLAKNVFLTPDKTIKRKLQETLLALWLERSFSKNEILEKYLSRVYFGGGNWGLEAASQHYFGKDAADLDLGEAALMAGLLQAPSQYNPIANPDRAARRTAIVLQSMEQTEIITRQVRRETLIAPITISARREEKGSAYFADWVWAELTRKIGTPTQDIIVRTTLDLRAQEAAEKAGSAHIDPKRGAHQAALLSMSGDGAIVAMVGGTSYVKSEYNRAVQANRQPGSAFKPFVYLAGFESGLSPWDRRIDERIKIGDWSPRNFTNRYRGDVSLETAFAASINTVAVRISEEIGRNRVVETAAAHGLADLKPHRSLPLGAQTVTLLGLTQAYLPFANWGNAAEAHGILSISTSNGTPLYDRENTPPRKIVSSRSLGHINRIMKRTVDAGTGKKARLAGWDVAGKTGTTNDYRDAWFMGYVPDMVTGVWVGADDNSPMKRVTGGSLPAAIWHDMMKTTLQGRDNVALPVSEPPLRAAAENTLDILLKDLETALP